MSLRGYDDDSFTSDSSAPTSTQASFFTLRSILGISDQQSPPSAPQAQSHSTTASVPSLAALSVPPKTLHDPVVDQHATHEQDVLFGNVQHVQHDQHVQPTPTDANLTTVVSDENMTITRFSLTISAAELAIVRP